ncbi:MAG: endonuclease III [Sulfurimonas sp. RIFOXYD12_FULL_33_39]|uniref:endonuclease III n=1 Tax=unclassified Sulfurimonas TaxID=2623549 RepID=UPI0008B1E4E2|nr:MULTISPECIES: endonuclease III [unclassified Sulfurimonas]OHE04023.1 MAG: endonuclease III [Sulfurimonas sp. RIFCSPLOWO2_12_FULL_34_6]OHE08752.1 MAG: endonuclease III [Sulfurimonas sp. RIFOXYD12_FULL_33_39]OHE14037.1 MAG: endonuclease III [Sulfurimonas sp. RIFOXYD2_FULL_34_21]DAB27643.1 MAG TPA: endonuclease III [Sulfurimonas sp. UBA10385]
MKKATKQEIREIHQLFIDNYSNAVTELDYENAYELVVAVALSAQCTDKRVNIITPALFEKYPNPATLAKADVEDVKSIINSCSFFNNKAKNIIEMAKRVTEVYDGEIPMDEKELITLAGVGQKTAHVVMIEYTGANLMAVDTHVFRVSHRLGLSDDTTPIKTEATLVKKFKNNLRTLHQGMVLFGRYICRAKNPKCTECFLASYCKTKESFKV